MLRAESLEAITENGAHFPEVVKADKQCLFLEFLCRRLESVEVPCALRACAYVCVCVCVRACMCVCMFVSVRMCVSIFKS